MNYSKLNTTVITVTTNSKYSNYSSTVSTVITLMLKNNGTTVLIIENITKVIKTASGFY
jgi:hypothetical protein